MVSINTDCLLNKSVLLAPSRLPNANTRTLAMPAFRVDVHHHFVPPFYAQGELAKVAVYIHPSQASPASADAL